MSTKQKSTRHGPIGTSCITCRRRRKKCDKTRPLCKRCAVGGFTCLGYSCPDENAPTLTTGAGATTESLATSGYSTVTASALENAESASSQPHLNLPEALEHCVENESLDIQPCAMPYRPHQLSPPWSPRVSHLVHGAESPDRLPSCRTRVTHDHPLGRFISGVLNTRQSTSAPNQSSPSYIPPNPSPVPNEIGQVITYVLSQFERLVGLSFFEPVRQQFTQFRASIGRRLLRSGASLWVKYLTCKIFESTWDGTSQRKAGLYNRSLQTIELRIQMTSDQSLTPAESYNRLAGALEIVFVKLMFARGTSTYQLLRNMAPTFLQLVFAEPTLWPDPTNFSSLSLAHVLNSTNYELSRFTLLDALHSMAFGLPQVIEYDTSIPPLHKGVWPSEWVHGCPIELQFALVEINKHCNARIRVAPEPDWRPIEHRIKYWRPFAQHLPCSDSWKTIATLAVQESWRHTLLVYLYMGLCNASSDDDRVQASVRQIFQLREAS
ncbi:hypothetical protein FRC08_004096 [Ceratobasidium sp. 394]|nr:hypothetical protein FRC08_004096 [Ceratobasidium sp. 394]